jgi:hypothetical protein
MDPMIFSQSPRCLDVVIDLLHVHYLGTRGGDLAELDEAAARSNL